MEIKHKSKPFNVKKLFFRILTGVCVGFAFGLALVAAVMLFSTDLKNAMGLNQDNSVVIQVGEGQDQDIQEAQTDNENTSVDHDVLNQHQQMYYTLYGVGNKADKTLVGINQTSGTGKKTEAQADCGVIITQTSEEVLILCTPGSVKGADTARITFYGGQTVSGQVYATDKETGILIMRVELEKLSKYTINNIGIAQIGDSNTLNRGQYVIAVGSPLGELRSTLVGKLTSVRGTLQYQDREHTALETDILGKSFSEGFLISQTGKIIGVLTHDGDEPGENLVLKAFAISDLSDVLEKLCNNEAIPSIGITVSTITSEMAKIYGIPEGVYVDNVSLNSPAVNAGIHKGDVIVGFGPEEISSAKQYTQHLMRMKPGDTVTLTILRYDGEKYGEMAVEVTVDQQ